MKIKLTTLCENTASGPNIAAEWGWSIFIEADGIKILFDTGGGMAAALNADQMGVDLNAVDKIILSHAHPDHTGGLRDILRRTDNPEVIAHPAVWAAKYSRQTKDKKAVYRGIPFAKAELDNFADFTLSESPVRISEDILTTGEIPRTTEYETIESHFWVKQKEELVPDDFRDDLALIIKTPKGLVIILGCAHRGIINTIQHARTITGVDTIHTVIGGTHLFPKKDLPVDKTVQALKELDVQNIGVSHCTGFKAAMRLSEAFGDRFFLNNAGTVRSIE
jgi:7,8-dihydropterin-6-yl-methyl-4-(beta-D-ribofuranosyl)aminobenzene 5'-phosphate synthase